MKGYPRRAPATPWRNVNFFVTAWYRCSRGRLTVDDLGVARFDERVSESRAVIAAPSRLDEPPPSRNLKKTFACSFSLSAVSRNSAEICSKPSAFATLAKNVYRLRA